MTGTCGTANWNTSTLSHTNGLLTGVNGFARSLTYTAAGTVAKVDHVGPLVDTYTPDATGVRPKTIEFSGYDTCVPPSVQGGSPQDVSIGSGQSATLTVSAANATGYQWFQEDGTRLAGATLSTYTTPALTTARSYFVEVYNDCAAQKSRTATVSVCPALSITSGTPQDQSITPGQTATLTVTVAGATAYQWYESDGTKLTGQTAATFTTPPLTSTKSYSVVASNDCGALQSRTATVNVCSTLSITSGTPQDRSIAPEQTATLTVTAAGATAYQWYESNGTKLTGQTAATFTTPPLTSAKSYYAVASNDCGALQSRTATVTVRPLSAPTGLQATANGTSSVSISWNPSADAHHYVLERKTGGADFQPIQTVFGTAATDSPVEAGKTYVYSVRAVSQTGLVSSPLSNADLATTMVFTPLTVGDTVIAAAHFDQLLAAVNAVRGANGWPPVGWGSILPAGVPAPASGGVVKAQHILSLRSAMNSARTALGLGALAYTDPSPAGLPIRVVHLTEIRGGAQ